MGDLFFLECRSDLQPLQVTLSILALLFEQPSTLVSGHATQLVTILSRALGLSVCECNTQYLKSSNLRAHRPCGRETEVVEHEIKICTERK